MSKRFSDRILEHLQQPGYKPVEAARLARALGIAEEEAGDFHEAVDALRRVGRVVLGTNNALMLPRVASEVAGLFRSNPRGFGFVVPDGPTVHGDLFIAPGESLDAVTGDRVLCKVLSRGKREGKDAFGGRVIKIIERGHNRFVGELCREGALWFVQPDGHALHTPVMVGDVGAKGARPGEQVVVEIVKYPSGREPAHGVIVERLGELGKPGVDLVSVIRQYNLPDTFSEACLEAARATSMGFDAEAAAEGREDLSDMMIVTIDPDDARDFDDAISLRRLDGGGEAVNPRAGVNLSEGVILSEAKDLQRSRRKTVPRGSGEMLRSAQHDTQRGAQHDTLGDAQHDTQGGARHDTQDDALHHATRSRKRQGGAAWELGVHIADVSTFVPVGGPIDQDATERCTSVYFPGFVIPMLPEVLSNGLCSLQEDQPRLCKSAFIQYDAEGRVLGTRFANTIIRSNKRLTYRQATAILEGKGGKQKKAVVDLVKEMDRLARAIQRRRLADGMIVLDLPEVELILDESGKVKDAQPADTSFSHTIIEMFMVEANEAVGRLLRRLQVPFIRRIHPDPDEEAGEAVGRFLRLAGHVLPKKFTRHDLQRLLAELRGQPESYAVSLAVLKSMELATYSPQDVGHYALASDCYTHFTSPIRRYADLMIHRLLQAYLEGRLGGREAASGGGRHGTAGGVGRRGAAGRGRHAGAAGVLDEDALDDWGRRLSYSSRRAESAERELKTLKILQFLESHVGEVFEGVITGVASFGMWVQHPRFLVEGLVRVEDLGNDWWEVDVSRGSIQGTRTRQTFRMGQRAKVRIVEVDLAARQLNLALEALPGKRGKGPGKGDQREESGGKKGGRGRGRSGKPKAGPPPRRGGKGPKRGRRPGR